MKYVYKTNIPRFVRYATQVWGIENDPFNPEAVALEGIARTKAFFKSLGMPVTMAEVGAKKEDYDYLAKHSQRNPDGTLGNFVKMDTKEILGVFALAE
jgi:alcohol dehydrogenase YqhD (iron-dependent ADH family)